MHSEFTFAHSNKYYAFLFIFFFSLSFSQDIDITLNSLNTDEAVFTQDDIFKKVSAPGSERNNTPDFVKKVLEAAEFVGKNAKGDRLYTGKKYRRSESSVISKFIQLSNENAKIVCKPEVISEVLKHYPYMSEEQKSAVIGICDKNNLDIVIGKAGSGKTTILKAVAEIYTKSGAKVIGMSLSSLASENLERHTGIESNSIAYWAHHGWKPKTKANGLEPGDIMIVDEAGMVGTSDWNKILKVAKKNKAKLIIVGDCNQFYPISAGDCLRVFINITLCSNAGLSAKNSNKELQKANIFELNKIVRQKEKWMRDASTKFSELNIAGALKMYKNKGKVQAIADTVSPTAKKYLDLEKTGSTVVLCYTKSECAEINNAIRLMKKEKGELGEDIVTLNDKSFAKNDRIMFLKNSRNLNIKNGQTAVIKSFNNYILEVETKCGIKSIDIDEYDNIDYAYAITMHKSQGKTFENTIIIASRAMDSRSCYVAMTRHSKEAHLCYKKSDFKSFADLVTSASKITEKNSLFDYESCRED